MFIFTSNIIGSRYQPPSHFPASRPPQSSQAAEQAKGGSEWMHVIDSDDGWSSDEFDDITDQDSVNTNQPHDVSRIQICTQLVHCVHTPYSALNKVILS